MEGPRRVGTRNEQEGSSPGSDIRDVFEKGGERLRHHERAFHEDSLGCSCSTGTSHMSRGQPPLPRV